MSWGPPGVQEPSQQIAIDDDVVMPVEVASAPAQGAPDLGALVMAWSEAKYNATFFADVEMTARKALSAAAFGATVGPGTHRFGFANGYTLKLGQRETLEFVELEGVAGDKARQIFDLEDRIGALGGEAPFLVERLIKWAPSVSKTEYDKLDPSNPMHVKIKEMIDTHLVTKKGAPALELEDPKEPKE